MGTFCWRSILVAWFAEMAVEPDDGLNHGLLNWLVKRGAGLA